MQIFSHRLVEDFGYPKDIIQTRPQYRVRKRPSDEEKSYPVDIAVFRGEMKIEDDLFMVVECKKKTRKDGVAQLRLYLDMSAAEVGGWFNGRVRANGIPQTSREPCFLLLGSTLLHARS